LDFIGVINPNSSTEHKFILTATDYFTRWSEVEAVKEVDQKTIIKFIERLITKYGIPQIIISDNGPAFFGAKVFEFVLK